jgi:hypothetical protein
MRSLTKYLIAFFLFALVNKSKAEIYAPKLTESDKIKLLIKYVRSLKDAVFIRNGDEHTPAEAADHMELKLKKSGVKVKTAIQFIAYCASKSSLSGKDYQVKLADGKTYKSMDLLLVELKRIEKENQT